MNNARSSAILLWLLLVFASLASAQEVAPPSLGQELLDSFLAAHEFKEVAVSPDGRWVAWVEGLRPNTEATPKSAVYLADLHAPATKPRRITAGDGKIGYDEHGIAWSGDSERLAFLSDKEQAGQLQVCIASPTGDAIRQLTHVSGFLADPRWSPDGERLALLFTEGVARAAGPTQPANRAVGPAEKLSDEQRLAVLDVETGQLRSISPPDYHVYEYDWSPDSGQIVAIAAPAPGDNNWYVADLYLVQITSGDMRPLVKSDVQIAAPSWSPDGRTIAFIGGLMSDEGLTGGDIFVIPAAGGEPRNLTASMRASASWLAWSPSSNELLFAEHFDGASGIASLEVRSGTIKTLWSGDETITATPRGYGITPSISLSRDEQASALVRHSFQQPPEVWAGPIGRWHPITHANAKQPSWGESKSLHWQNGDERVQGWLIYPSRFEAGRRYPLIVSVHGGPASAWKPRWPRHSDLTWLSALDYFVFCPNPRGSLGQGTAFARANVRDFGHGDLQDILSGVDKIIRTVPEVDEKRLAIAGFSYGGYMTMWAVTQTDRFRAAIAGAGIANWQSYYGQNEIDQWLLPYFGASVYDDPAVYAKSSPIEFVKRVATPTLLLVGERDKECPAVQSREFWHALKTLHVPTDLIIYPDEGHSIANIKHRRDIAERSAAWLQQHLMGSGASE